jgi:hypothetical protein
MANYPLLIKQRLAAPGPLATLLTGGIYEQDSEVPANGINRKTLPAVYENGGNGKMKPFAVVHGRAQVPFSPIKEPTTQFRPTRQVVEIYVRIDRDTPASTLRTAQDLIYGLLEQKRVAGSWKILYTNILEYDDPDLNNAPTMRLEYTVVGHLGN